VDVKACILPAVETDPREVVHCGRAIAVKCLVMFSRWSGESSHCVGLFYFILIKGNIFHQANENCLGLLHGVSHLENSNLKRK
jgi:hypothetical protein